MEMIVSKSGVFLCAVSHPTKKMGKLRIVHRKDIPYIYIHGSIFVAQIIPAMACNFFAGVCVLKLKTRTR